MDRIRRALVVSFTVWSVVVLVCAGLEKVALAQQPERVRVLIGFTNLPGHLLRDKREVDAERAATQDVRQAMCDHTYQTTAVSSQGVAEAPIICTKCGAVGT